MIQLARAQSVAEELVALLARDGALWQGSERIPCPEEHHFFAALGLDWIEPGGRA